MLLVSESKHKEVSEFGFGILDVSEGRGDTLFSAELVPDSKELALGGSVFVANGIVSDRERSAEIRLEASSSGRCRSTQGLSCG